MRRDEIPLFKARGRLTNVEPSAYEEHGEPLLACLREMASIVDPDFPGTSDRDAEPHESIVPVISAPAPAWPADLGLEMPESFLLRPENGIVPFHGFRQPLLQVVLDWALAEHPRVALRLDVGPGGSGKTRLMIEACRRLKGEHGWESALLASAPDALASLEALLGSGRHCIVVVDYAETRPGDVVALARAALGVRCTGKVRLALLARNAGAWWERLADGEEGVLKAVLESPSSKTGPYRIDEERVPVGGRAAVFEEALRAYAAKKGMPVPDGGRPNLTTRSERSCSFIWQRSRGSVGRLSMAIRS